MNKLRTTPWLLAGLVLLTAGVYARVLEYRFVNYDDDRFVTANPYVNRGLTWDGLLWSLGLKQDAAHKMDQPKPLTWWSHQLDAAVWGLRPGGHHLTSLLIHLLNLVVLWLLVGRLGLETTARVFVVGVFALHPVQVEAVAWVAERKTVLCTLWLLLSLWCYVRWVRQTDGPGRRRWGGYAAWNLLGVAALASKPMAVTLPALMLLLDAWPLRRYRSLRQDGWPLLREKLSLFAAVALSCAATMVAQRDVGSVNSLAATPLLTRLAHWPVAYVGYLRMLFWPDHLWVFYRHPGMPPGWQWGGSLALLLAIFVGAWGIRRRAPGVLVGWLWFLGMLAPVTGIIQVGGQGWADRYLYQPMIGITLALACGLGALSTRWRQPDRRWTRAAIGVVMVVLACRTWSQVAVWRDSLTLFGHAVQYEPGAYVVNLNLGSALLAAGRLDEAERYFHTALERDHNAAGAPYSLALLAGRRGDWLHAIVWLSRTMRIRPDMPDARGLLEDALQRFTDELHRAPQPGANLIELAEAQMAMQHWAEAAHALREARRMEPGNPRIAPLLAEAERRAAAATRSAP